MSDINSASSWEVGRTVATTQLDLQRNALTTCVRVLHSDFVKGDQEFSIASKYLLTTLIRGRSVQAPLYYAAATFAPKKAAEIGKMTVKSIGKIFSPGEISVILALSFIFRRIQKWSALEAFQLLGQTMHIFTDLGGLVGSALAPVGLRRGLLVGGIRHLALAAFLGYDEKSFLKYRRAVRLEEKFFDLETEYQLWGTTHLHVASHLIQILGLGLDDARVIVEAFLPEAAANTALQYDLQITETWIESLYRTGKPPEIVHQGSYYPKASEVAALSETSSELRSMGSTFQFITRKREDVSPEKTPALYLASSDTSSGDEDSSTMPKELLNELSPEELSSLKTTE